MRAFRDQTLPALLLGASVLFASGCGARDEQRAQQVAENRSAAETEVYPNEDGPRDPELRAQPRSVDVGEEPPPVASESDLEAQERRLAARQAELDARERLLRQRERQGQARVAPKPAPKPAPAPRPEAEQPRVADRPQEDTEVEVRPAPEPELSREEEEEEAALEPEEMPEPESASVTVPSGTVLSVEFLEGLGSNSNAAGDTFRVRVSDDVVEDGVVAIPGGSEVLGVVTEAVPLRKVGGRARLALKFTDLVLPSGATVPVDASFLEEGRSQTGKDAATIGGGAAGGAVLGRVISKKDRSKGAILGAIIGAAVGTAIASKTAGEEVVIPEGAVISLKLDGPVEVRARR